MLLNNLKRLSKDSLIYGVGNVIEYIAAFFLLPIFTRVFTPSDYGILDTIATFISVLNLFLLMGLNSAMQRYYFDAKREGSDGSKVISTTIIVLSFFSIIISLLIFPFTDQISNLFFNSIKYTHLIRIAILSIPLSLLVKVLKDIFRLKFKPLRFSIVTIIHFLLRISIILILILIYNKGLLGNFYGILFSVFIVTFITFLMVKKYFKFSFSLNLAKNLLKFGIPLAFAGFSYWILSLSDRFFILKFSTLGQFGLYSIGNKIGSVLVLVITAIHLAWFPLIFEKYKEKSSKDFIIKTFTYTSIIFIFIAIFLTSFSREALIILASESYVNAYYIVWLLTLGSVFLGISGIISTGLTIAKKTKYITISSFIAAILNIILNILLIPKFGIIGASIATSLSYLSLFFTYYYFAKKYFPLHFELKKVSLIFIIGIVYLILGTYIKFDSLLISLITKIIFVITFPILLYLFNIFSRAELNFVKNLLSNKYKSSK